VGFANRVLLWSDMALVRTPSIGVKAGDAKRFEQFLQWEQYLVFSPPKDIR
jgi:hypothetical protein